MNAKQTNKQKKKKKKKKKKKLFSIINAKLLIIKKIF